jgi:hypothetical protein
VYRQRKKEIEQRRADDMMIGDDAPPPAPVAPQAPEPPEKPDEDDDE